MYGDDDWLDISQEQIDIILERIDSVEKCLDVIMCGNNLSYEQRDKLEKAWINIRSIYYPCVLEKENKK